MAMHKVPTAEDKASLARQAKENPDLIADYLNRGGKIARCTTQVAAPYGGDQRGFIQSRLAKRGK